MHRLLAAQRGKLPVILFQQKAKLLHADADQTVVVKTQVNCPLGRQLDPLLGQQLPQKNCFARPSQTNDRMDFARHRW